MPSALGNRDAEVEGYRDRLRTRRYVRNDEASHPRGHRYPGDCGRPDQGHQVDLDGPRQAVRDRRTHEVERLAAGIATDAVHANVPDREFGPAAPEQAG